MPDMSMVTEPEPSEQIVEDATCTFCGCLCDDIALSVEGNRITEARNACALGESWFFSQRNEQGPACLIEGKPASLERRHRTGRADLDRGKISAYPRPL